MAFGASSDFQNAYNGGYYFDRGIDLEFYDSANKLLGKITTPEQGMKPSITVKGTLIEGSYAVNSYISVQNLAYDINVNAVQNIKCTIYYNGLRDSNADINLKYGHTFLFSVLYSDQEKEPPNRAVRFQCSLAAFDFAARGTYVDVQKGTIKLAKEGTKAPVASGTGGKNGSKKDIIKFIKELAEVYNSKLDERDAKATGKNDLKAGNLIKIKKIRYPKVLKEAKFSPPTLRTTLKELMDSMNNISLGKDVANFNGGNLKIVITPGVLSVDIIPPANWTEQMKKNGIQENNYVIELIKESFEDVIDESIGAYSNSFEIKDSRNSPIKLNYVKSAFRNEIIITCTTIYDDRIRAGSYCVIAGNAIMGKHAARSSRIIKMPGQKVLFRATGAIEYEFSTTEDSFMTLTGPVVDEDYKEPNAAPKVSMNR